MNYEVKIESKNGINVVSSRVVAKQLGKKHSDVLDSLNKILENGNFRSLIISSNYQVKGQKRSYKEYLLTKDGFTLYMFNIQGYNDYKMAYINEFNKMEQALKKNITQEKLPFSSTVMIPIDKIEYWNKIKELSNEADDVRSEIYHKLNLLSNMVVSITREVDKLSNIVFETEDNINKIESRDMNLNSMLALNK
uniref:Regulatory protein n=1 Tax=Myoviridae sp. ctSyg22 TaxID=2823545 RepID=A0A8S5L942_9CAUD|nr:MAG TPA: regulatory protein [Myoviridae sp. ctSyg22]